MAAVLLTPLAFLLIEAGGTGARTIVHLIWRPLRFWPGPGMLGKYMAALALGALSPPLLTYGAVIPEDKGVQILLMVAALLTARSSITSIRIFVAPIILGLSVAFKGLGMFIAPLCLYYALQGVINREKRNWRLVTLQAFVFVSLAVLSCAIWFVPFGEGTIRMMLIRIQSGNASIVKVQHASIWRYFQQIFPGTWNVIRNSYMVIMALIIAYGFWRRRVTPAIITAFALIIFIDVWLLAGSLDRMNIGILVSILLLGEFWIGNRFAIVSYYAIGGLIVLCNWFPLWTHFLYGVQFIDGEYLDALFCLGFTGLVTAICIRESLWPTIDGIREPVNRANEAA